MNESQSDLDMVIQKQKQKQNKTKKPKNNKKNPRIQNVQVQELYRQENSSRYY